MFTFKKKMSLIIFFILNFLVLTAYANPVKMLAHEANDPQRGNRNGSITLVEFFDYQCSHCVNMAPVIDAVIRANPQLRVVYKEFPILGPLSELASRAALAANKQGKYGEFSHRLMMLQPLNEQMIYSAAAQTGLNLAQFKRDINSKYISNQLKTNYALAKTLKISSTPSFYVGKTSATSINEYISNMGELSQSELQNMIDKVG